MGCWEAFFQLCVWNAIKTAFDRSACCIRKVANNSVFFCAFNLGIGHSLDVPFFGCSWKWAKILQRDLLDAACTWGMRVGEGRPQLPSVTFTMWPLGDPLQDKHDGQIAPGSHKGMAMLLLCGWFAKNVGLPHGDSTECQHSTTSTGSINCLLLAVRKSPGTRNNIHGGLSEGHLAHLLLQVY